MDEDTFGRREVYHAVVVVVDYACLKIRIMVHSVNFYDK